MLTNNCIRMIWELSSHSKTHIIKKGNIQYTLKRSLWSTRHWWPHLNIFEPRFSGSNPVHLPSPTLSRRCWQFCFSQVCYRIWGWFPSTESYGKIVHQQRWQTLLRSSQNSFGEEKLAGEFLSWLLISGSVSWYLLKFPWNISYPPKNWEIHMLATTTQRLQLQPMSHPKKHHKNRWIQPIEKDIHPNHPKQWNT